MCLTQKSSVI